MPSPGKGDPVESDFIFDGSNGFELAKQINQAARAQSPKIDERWDDHDGFVALSRWPEIDLFESDVELKELQRAQLLLNKFFESFYRPGSYYAQFVFRFDHRNRNSESIRPGLSGSIVLELDMSEPAFPLHERLAISHLLLYTNPRAEIPKGLTWAEFQERMRVSKSRYFTKRRTEELTLALDIAYTAAYKDLLEALPTKV